MTIRHRVTLYIISNDKLLIIRRNRNGRSHFVMPGGGVEEGESVTEAALREAYEETCLDVTLGPRLWVRPFSTPMSDGRIIEQMEYAYLITEFSGTPRLGMEFEEKVSADNEYQLDWINVADLAETAVYPSPLYETAVQAISGRLK